MKDKFRPLILINNSFQKVRKMIKTKRCTNIAKTVNAEKSHPYPRLHLEGHARVCLRESGQKIKKNKNLERREARMSIDVNNY